MQLIMAVIRPFKLADVCAALAPLDVREMTVEEVKGFGRQQGLTELYRGAECQVHFLPEMKISLVVADDLAGPVVAAVARGARTGRIGDGKVFALETLRAVRIRTGETGPDAL